MYDDNYLCKGKSKLDFIDTPFLLFTKGVSDSPFSTKTLVASRFPFRMATWKALSWSDLLDFLFLGDMILPKMKLFGLPEQKEQPASRKEGWILNKFWIFIIIPSKYLKCISQSKWVMWRNQIAAFSMAMILTNN